jgi:RNA polymerase sigma factor (sigma-70 family)
MLAASQQNVMALYERAALLQGSFPCRPAAVGVILAAPSWSTRRERRMDDIQAQDAGADRRRSALMAAAQAGDGVAYQALLRDCIPVIKNVARRRGVVADRIDDMVQDVLLTVHRARQAYDPSRSFTAWLCVIADRRAIDLLRRIRRQDVREVHAPLAFESHADEAADPVRGLAHADATGTVARALASLPTRQREAVQHLVLEERSLADAAALTRRTKGSLKVNLHRALKALRGRMEPGP